jgi:hypothetical protein
LGSIPVARLTGQHGLDVPGAHLAISLPSTFTVDVEVVAP